MKTLTYRVAPEIAAQPDALKLYIAKTEGIDARTINEVRIRRRSIDARQRSILVNLTLDVYINEQAPKPDFLDINYPDVSAARQAVVVGAGPGGLFAALRLIELGIRPIVLERGKDVHERRKDIARISREHKVDPESNYSFGMGGAGAFSDGKLYTRSKKRGDVDKILRVFCRHGAAVDILCDAHPHIGTDKLPAVIETMCRSISEAGGEVHMQTRVDALLMDSDRRICGVRTQDGKEIEGPVILATGHSARDVYRTLHKTGIRIEPKGIAVGVRLEHSSQLIDRLQYHNKNGRGRWLPAAEYSYVVQSRGRGVYSFCMCPGGVVVPAASGPRQIVVNGMSSSARNSAWSNSGMVVETHPEDLDGELKPFMMEMMDDELFAPEHSDFEDSANPLRLMYFQEALEQRCWQMGNFKQTAPAQRMKDFVNRKLSYDLPASSYTPGLVSSPLHFWMPEFITSRLADGFEQFGRRCPGFLTNEALMIAAETRTSAPVRIPRQRDTLQHDEHPGLFPCGEGAGFAGGIVSAAIDGERCAEALAASLEG